ncbi:hypothetical protein K469DRAFT_320512 [Zopfia rhizophila CBS 207.26]|uniref:Uncharacterized protein n=1 Tax=Zopfia rhizophila CBS 207.26 TaxID=1314779 RepID=A0A6A6DJU0_9PEZI|nr:hypothetical protein K469DRAFT_320512 [Zopfia rhizophila CBS 207.26]
MTRESGRLPPCCVKGKQCWICSGRRLDEERVEPVSYLVVKVMELECSGRIRWYKVCFALLSRVRLDAWRGRVLPRVVGMLMCCVGRDEYCVHGGKCSGDPGRQVLLEAVFSVCDCVEECRDWEW